MKIALLGLLLCASTSAFAAPRRPCDRVIGTPGFTFTDESKETARFGAMGKCEDYKLKTGEEGDCRDLGCNGNFEGTYTCLAEIVTCE